MSLPQGTDRSPFLIQQSHIIRATGDLNSGISTRGAPMPSTSLGSGAKAGRYVPRAAAASYHSRHGRNLLFLAQPIHLKTHWPRHLANPRHLGHWPRRIC